MGKRRLNSGNDFPSHAILYPPVPEVVPYLLHTPSSFVWTKDCSLGYFPRVEI